MRFTKGCILCLEMIGGGNCKKSGRGGDRCGRDIIVKQALPLGPLRNNNERQVSAPTAVPFVTSGRMLGC